MGVLLPVTNTSSSTPITLKTATVTLEDGSAASDGGYQSTYGVQTMLAGETTPVQLLAPYSLGCQRSKVTLHSSANDLDFYVDSYNTLPLNQVSGGTITATPSCPDNVCVQPTTLSTTPNAGARFVGWMIDTGCSADDPTCDMRNATTAPFGRFASSSSPSITYQRTGTDNGWVLFYETDGRAVVCTASCSYTPSSAVTVVAGTATFAGWTGACTGPSRVCNLGAISANVVLGASFTAQDRQLATIRPDAFHPGEVDGGARLPNGDFVFAGQSLWRMTPGGTVVWRQRQRTFQVVANAAGDIFDTTVDGQTPVLERRDATGARIWSRSLIHTIGYWGYPTARIALTSTGAIAVVVADELHVISPANGADLWSATVPPYGVIAADTAGHVIVASPDVNMPVSYIARYDSTGAHLTPDWTVSGEVVAVATTSNDHVVVRTSLNSDALLTRLRTNGNVVYSVTDPSVSPVAMTVASNGDILVLDAVDGSTGLYRVQRRGSSGSATWTMTYPNSSDISVVGGSIGTWLRTVVPDATGGFALVGFEAVEGYLNASNAYWPWIRTYGP